MNLDIIGKIHNIDNTADPENPVVTELTRLVYFE